MHNDNATQQLSFEDQTSKAITALQNVQKQLMNRHLACEAIVTAMLAHVPPDVLQNLLEEYQTAIGSIAIQLLPEQQAPQLWHQWEDAILARMQEEEHQIHPRQPFPV